MIRTTSPSPTRWNGGRGTVENRESKVLLPSSTYLRNGSKPGQVEEPVVGDDPEKHAGDGNERQAECDRRLDTQPGRDEPARDGAEHTAEACATPVAPEDQPDPFEEDGGGRCSTTGDPRGPIAMLVGALFLRRRGIRAVA